MKKQNKTPMTITDFIKKYGTEWTSEDIKREFPPQKTANGICFKLNTNDPNKIDPNTIVYVSESAYEGRTNEIYTVEDISNILRIYFNTKLSKKTMEKYVKDLFQIADWQNIETLANEYASGMEEEPQYQSIDSKIATLQAYKRGKVIEIFCYNCPEEGWVVDEYPLFNFNSFAYRARRNSKKLNK